MLAVALAAVTGAPAATADDRATANAVLEAQFVHGKQEAMLNACLAASPHKNTPCIRHQALLLAQLSSRELASVKDAMDGSERACVRKVALDEMAYLTLVKQGSLLLHQDERQKAKKLFLKSVGVYGQMKRIEAGCFAHALTGG